MDGSVLISQTEEVVTARHRTEGKGVGGWLRVEVRSIEVGCDGLIVIVSRAEERGDQCLPRLSSSLPLARSCLARSCSSSTQCMDLRCSGCFNWELNINMS